ncbi:hypothetical protein J4Q44_G00059520 [Coregonus suidteri]|uniref:Uncharacterized protein n=1 Tax=Coregonus suidteri TaxID=861788 RepID=A0AAN8R4Q0_9TELE
MCEEEFVLQGGVPISRPTFSTMGSSKDEEQTATVASPLRDELGSVKETASKPEGCKAFAGKGLSLEEVSQLPEKEGEIFLRAGLQGGGLGKLLPALFSIKKI